MLIDDADLKVNPNIVRHFVKTANPNARLVYFVGNLAEERSRDRTLAATAQAAYEAAEEGSCLLFQKRYADEAMIYFLEKR